MIAAIENLQTRFGELFFVRKKYEVTIYFDGPNTKFGRSSRDWQFEEFRECVRSPLVIGEKPMPPPHASEWVASKQFRTRYCARIWALSKCDGMTNLKADVRPL